MPNFLIGMALGAAIALASAYLGHAYATRYWNSAVTGLRHAKIKAEDELAWLKSKNYK